MKQITCNVSDLLMVFVLVYMINQLVQLQGGYKQCMKNYTYKPYY